MANPTLLSVFSLVLLYAAWTLLFNTPSEYATQEYWETATIEDVDDIPDAALEPGNLGGPVLMWAAATTRDPRIITKLVRRGALINESDELLNYRNRSTRKEKDRRIMATPLSAAAAESNSPEVVAELIRLGARVDSTSSYGNTPLMIAASTNKDERITRELLKHGADLSLKNDKGKTALDRAKNHQNAAVIKVLEKAYADLQLD